MTYFDTYRSVFSVCACWSVFIYLFIFYFLISVHVGIVGVFLLYITYMYIHVSWYIFLRLVPRTFFIVSICN